MRAVSNSIHLPMDPESAIGLFLDENHLQGWWRVEGCLVEPRAGGVYTLAWEVTPEGLGYVTSGIIEEVGAGILRIGSVVYLNPRRPILGPMTLAVTAKTIAGGAISPWSRAGTARVPTGTGTTMLSGTPGPWSFRRWPTTRGGMVDEPLEIRTRTGQAGSPPYLAPDLSMAFEIPIPPQTGIVQQ